MSKHELELTKLNLGGGTQARHTLRPEAIEDYAEQMKKQVKDGGLNFPPMRAYHETLTNGDGSATDVFWLSRGFHRYYAAEKAGLKMFPVEVIKGTLRDAILDAAGDNADHGVQRTQADKRKAVKLVLSDAEWANRSNKWVAEACKVSDHLVKEVRDELEAKAKAEGKATAERAKRVGKDGKARTAKATSKQLCQRCQRIGKPIAGCPGCAEVRAGNKKAKAGKVKFDFRGFEKTFGALTRGVDAIAKAYDDHGSEQKGCNRILSEFYKAYEPWKKKLMKS